MDGAAAAIETFTIALEEIQTLLSVVQSSINTARGQLLGGLGTSSDAQILRTTQATVNAAEYLASAVDHLQSAVGSAAAFAAQLGLSVHTDVVAAGRAAVFVHIGGEGFAAPKITVDRHGQLTNGTYTLDSAGMDPHVNGTAGKSQFRFYVNSGQAVVDGAAYADEYALWVGNKAKVPVANRIIGYTGDGTPTSWLNVYRNKNGFVHGSPGNPP